MNTVSSLIETPFLKRNVMEKLIVQDSERPMPHLKLATMELVDGKSVVICFTPEIYKENEWICGCSERNALFCYPCLLFEGPDHWSKTGYHDLGHLKTAINKHEITPIHKRNMLSFSRFSLKVPEGTKNPLPEINSKIKKNTRVIIAIIETIKFCFMNCIPIDTQTDYKQNFLEILKMITPSDSTTETCLEQEYFDDLDSIQRDILRICSEIVRDKIVEEIREAEYVSLIVEGGDSKYSRVIILRYVKDCEPVERVWKIINRDEMKSFLENHVLKDLVEIIKHPVELISQSFDQLSLKKHDVTVFLPAKIQTVFPLAHLIHFYRQDIFDIICGVPMIQQHFQGFASIVFGISKLMTDDTPNSALIRFMFEQKILQANNVNNYDFAKKKIESIYLHKNTLLEIMGNITRNSAEYPDNLVSLADHFISSLQGDMCTSLLEIFFKMMPHFNKYLLAYENCTEIKWTLDPKEIRRILDAPVPNQMIDGQPNDISFEPGKVRVKIENEFDMDISELNTVEIIKTEMDEEAERQEELILPISTGSTKRKRNEDKDGQQKVSEIVIIENVVAQLKILLRFNQNMFASKLVDPKNFLDFSASFPELLFNTIANLHYFSAFETMQLQTELKVLYDHPDFQIMTSVSDILKKIYKDRLYSTFPQTVKLIKIVLTYPSLTDDPKRSLDTKNKVKKFLLNFQGFKNVDSLIYFGCERDIIESMKNFDDKVLQKFKSLPNRCSAFD